MSANYKKSGLIKSAVGHTTKYIFNDDFYALETQSLQIGKRYLITEITAILLKLQGGEFKIGDIAAGMEDQLNRNQIKYMLQKLQEDEIIITSGQSSGTKYLLHSNFHALRGDLLIQTVIKILSSKYNVIQ